VLNLRESFSFLFVRGGWRAEAYLDTGVFVVYGVYSKRAISMRAKDLLRDNGGVNLTAAGHSSLRPLMLPAVSMLVKPIEIPVRRPQVTPGALYANNGKKTYTQ
jgi:hypothetical protein